MTDRRFTHFVIFAEMRTGSNFLEENINQFPDLACHGELFNPHFIGGPNRKDTFGMTLKQRTREPYKLIEAIRAIDTTKVPGFRFFNDHDPRILKACLEDPACGKVVLTRNPLDSYVSRKIAGETGQWKLTNIKHKKSATITFDADEFTEFLQTAQDFQLLLLNALQVGGQTAFYINYDDIHSIDILNGLARFLGSSSTVDGLNTNLKPQNPATLASKVSNYSEMVTALGRLDFLNLSRTPNFEPRRGPAVPQYVAGKEASVLFMPVKGGPKDRIRAWMAAHETDGAQALSEGMNQKDLRAWREARPGFQAFTVLRHPLRRVHQVFSDYIATPDRAAFSDVRRHLIRDFGVVLPDADATTDYDLEGHSLAFLAFLKFVKANLAGQTSHRIDAAWASQTVILQGMAQLALPGHLIHEADLEAGLRHLEALSGLSEVKLPANGETTHFRLADTANDEIIALVREIYARDFTNFGFPLSPASL